MAGAISRANVMLKPEEAERFVVLGSPQGSGRTQSERAVAGQARTADTQVSAVGQGPEQELG